MSLESGTADFRIRGEGYCAGGTHPEPPLDGFPLLAWSSRFGGHDMVVHLEDGKASVHDIAVSLAECPDVAAVAAKFGTTEGHVRQALDYAMACSFVAHAPRPRPAPAPAESK